MNNDNVIQHPIFEWTLREDGAITLYILDDKNRTTRLVMFDPHVSALYAAMDLALDTLAIYHEDGFNVAEEIVNAKAAEGGDKIITDADIESLLDGDG